jgi:hypothetical protein
MAECKDCTRYVPNEKFDPKKMLSAVGYCRVPVRDTGGLMGTVEAGETLNITFARGPYRCRDGTRWFEPLAAGVALPREPEPKGGA